MAGKTQMSESFRTAAALAFVGGFLETYTFILHGHVFANAQTGNIALCGMAIAETDWISALKYALPVISFAIPFVHLMREAAIALPIAFLISAGLMMVRRNH